jgi:putative transcriptional regulator
MDVSIKGPGRTLTLAAQLGEPLGLLPLRLRLLAPNDRELDLEREELAVQPVFYGGPVQTERGFVLHDKREADAAKYNSTLSVPGGLDMTTSKDVLEDLASGAGPKRILVTLGYSGWQAGQLEDELGRNGWLTVDADPAVIFDTPIEQRYERALSLLGFDPRMLSQEAGHA